VRLILCCALTLLACGGDDDGGGGSGADAAESGRACATGLEADAPTAIASPALDCPSRVCLHVEGASPDLCTDDCEEASDCVGGAASGCDGDFVCAAPVEVGPFACRKFCVCDSAVPAGGFPVDCP
jgi:hypothetical protein